MTKTKSKYFDVYGETADGEIIHVDRVSTEDEAHWLCVTEENENPEADYWWEATYADEQ